jgi:glycosyltransferase involved in cell wall biosynthesis
MAKVRETTRLDDARCRVILNANAHPQPTIQHTASDFVRFLYFGRLHVSKGVAILLEALAGLADQFRFSVKVAGTGPEEERLRKAYANAHWCTFLGYRSQEVISDLIADSDLLCAPSIGWENSPGVVIHALSQGLPVMASDAGGLSELLVDNQNGRLVPPGDVVAWRRALQSVLLDPDQLAQWRAGAQAGSSRFDQDALGEQIYQFMLDTIGAASWR